MAWAMYASEGAWKRAPHLMFMATQLMRLVKGEIKRLCVSMPPRHGKSEFISKYFPTWWLGAHPGSKVIQCSYGQDLTLEWSRHARDIFATHGPRVFGQQTWARAAAKGWDTYYLGGKLTGGGVRAVGKGGALTGRGAHLLICDDLVKDAAEANNATLRENAWDWFTSVPLTRLEPGGVAVVVMTRWHHDDIIGRLEQQQAQGDYQGEPWTFFNLPCIAEEDDPLDRAKGEALWPDRWPAEWAQKKEAEVGSYVWSSLFQGRPTPLEGGMFKRAWISRFALTGSTCQLLDGSGDAFEIPAMQRMVTVDLASSKSTRADYTVMMVCAADFVARKLLVLDVVRERLEGPDIVPVLRKTMQEWGAPVAYVETIGFQSTLVQHARREGIPIHEVRPDRYKVSRAMPATAAMAGGQVFFRRDAPWSAALDSELLSFPHGEHDDMVDTLAYAVQLFNEALSAAKPVQRPKFRFMDPYGRPFHVGSR